MRRSSKVFLCLLTMDLMVPGLASVGFTLHQETRAAERVAAQQQIGAQRWLAQSTVELPLGQRAQREAEHRSAKFEACARRLG